MHEGRARATLYTTWYEFKKDLEKQLGCSLLNWRWMEVKPKAPLPWNKYQLKKALSASSNFRKS
jgi:hypothetical protein